MNLDSFYTYLEQPQTLNSQSLLELSELINRYPYFQSARLLYLKNLHLLNDYRYNDELKTVSAYAGDRQVLYELINENKTKEKDAVKKNNVSVISENNNTVNPIIEKTETTAEIPIEKIEQVIEKEVVIVNTNESSVIEVDEIKEEIIIENNIVPNLSETKITVLNSEIIPETSEINNLPTVSEEPILEAKPIIEEVSQKLETVQQPIKEEIITTPKQEITKPNIEPPKIIVEKKEVAKESTTPVKESVADIILKKVAAINAERAKSKEFYKDKIEIKPFVVPTKK